jgi:uncharacterized membrane protein YeiB
MPIQSEILGKRRDAFIDILRGLAVLMMVAGNMGFALAEPHPFWFRLRGTFTAPVFITLAGMMVAITLAEKGYSFSYYLKRGFVILAVGAIIDVFAWQILPFTTVDVLYFIAISIPIAHLLSQLSLRNIIIFIIVILAVTPIFQMILGYTKYPTEYNLDGTLVEVIKGQTSIINHWLSDGWFPVFPWIAFSGFGVLLSKIRLKYSESKDLFLSFKFFIFGIILILVGGIGWYLFPGAAIDRAGFCELYYPPTIGFYITAIGVVSVLMYIIRHIESWKIWEIIRPMGRSSLFLYTLQIFIIGRLIYDNYKELSLGSFFKIYGIITIATIILGILLKIIKNRIKNKSFLFRALLGS